MRRFLSLFTMLMLCGVLAFAQNRVVTGKVSDENNVAIPFATITETGTKNVVIADGNGNYSIKMRGTGGITITAAGYNAVTSDAAGNIGSVSLVRNASESLTEVVVTALGIQRQRKDLGYATAKINNAELTQSSPVNVANGLQGKVSGLNITSLNNGVFEDVRINLRGIRSLTGNNNPMLLLDGVQTGLGFLSSINPQDIQDVTILKGSSGAAIYGPDARNGVIVVTTKRGGQKNTPVITFSQTQQYSTISFFPEFQTEFGSGGSGAYIPYENWSWGPAFDGSQVELGSPLLNGSQQMVQYSPTNARKNFFNTGVTSQTDVSIGIKDFYLSIQDARIKGIVPDDKNRRTGIRLNTGRELGKLKVNFNVNYIQQNYDIFDDNQMGAYNAANNVGLNDGLLNLIFNTPAHVPITSYKDFKNNPYATYTGYFNHYGINPYIAIDNWRQTGKTDDLLTNLDFAVKASNSLSFTWRLGGSFRNTNAEGTSKGQQPLVDAANKVISPNTNTLIAGTVSQSFSRTSRLSSELFGNWNKTYGDFKFNVVAGHYLRESQTLSTNVGNSNLVVPELYNVNNRAGVLNGSSSKSKTRLMSLYGLVGVSYKGWANVEFTGRNDWTSVLAIGANNFFYPGVSGSLVLSDALPGMKSDKFLSYLKVRASVNKTGNADIDPYQLASTFGQGGGFPYGTLPGYTANNAALNPALKPEFINSKEVGLEATFFKNRFGVEVAAYTQDNTNQIIPVSISGATGYTSTFVNAAAFKNKGIELDLKLTPLVNLGDVRIDLKANATYSTSEIQSIYPGLDRIAIGGFVDAANYAVVGSPAFTFFLTDYARDDQGRVIVDKVSGYPTQDPNTKQYGRSMPLWIVGLSPSIQYKGLTLSVVGEYRGGHYAYAAIGSDMAWTGVSAVTAQNHRERFVMPNSVYLENGKYVENTNVTVADVNNFYTTIYRDVASNFLTKADSWRIREVSLGYDFPAQIFANQKLIKAANLTLNARNLFLFVPSSNQFTDPDFNNFSGNTSGVSTSKINPPTRTIGVNLTVTF